MRTPIVRSDDMISVEQALELVLQGVSVLAQESQPLDQSLGQVLAEDVASPLDLPSVANSAMDGYAVRAGDTVGATADSPRRLAVAGHMAAGQWSDRPLQPGEAVRIMTGAPVPPGSDVVVPFEDTEGGWGGSPGQTEVAVIVAARPGQHVRSAGEDVRRGERVLAKGTRLGPSQIATLAAIGRETVPVIRRPMVAVLATGDELAEIGQPLPLGFAYNANSHALAAQVAAAGGLPRLLGIAGDREDELAARLREGLKADLLVTTGGVSLGDFDLVKSVLATTGQVTFWRIRMKPGKPVIFGSMVDPLSGRSVPHLGLPGNPVSAMVTFELFARPAIRKMMGHTLLARPTVTAILEKDVPNDGRRFFARVIVTRRDGAYYARPTGPQGSNIVTSMARANGLAIISEDVALAPAGSAVTVQMIDWPEEMDVQA